MAQDTSTLTPKEKFMLGLTLWRYIDTHKPDGSDVEKFGEEIAEHLQLLTNHYDFHIGRLQELKGKLKDYGAKGWYQKRRKKATMKMIDSQMKAFEKEKASIADMMVRL